jgi:dTDP-4-amino-4,6-dideoxygalactose transaminase
LGVVGKMRIPILDLTPEIENHWEAFNAAFQDVLRSGQFILGPQLEKFESEVAHYLGVKHAIGVNSGTDALILGLESLGVGQGDEVITSAFSFFATAEAASHLGATPVFVDIDPVTFNLDPWLVESKITPRTKAIIPVHLFGHAVDLDPILSIGKRHKIPVLEDAAQAFGGQYKQKRLGSLGTASAFSFYPTKNLAAFGDGGLIATNDNEIASRVKVLRTHGSKKPYQNEIIGYNSRLDELQASFLRVKLPTVESSNRGRRSAAERYCELFQGWPDVRVPSEASYATHVFHQFTIALPAEKRDAVHELLKKNGIATMIYYPTPIHKLPVYAGFPELPFTEKAAQEVLSLPIWPQIKPEIQLEVARQLRLALDAAKV